MQPGVFHKYVTLKLSGIWKQFGLKIQILINQIRISLYRKDKPQFKKNIKTRFAVN